MKDTLWGSPVLLSAGGLEAVVCASGLAAASLPLPAPSPANACLEAAWLSKRLRLLSAFSPGHSQVTDSTAKSRQQISDCLGCNS